MTDKMQVVVLIDGRLDNPNKPSAIKNGPFVRAFQQCFGVPAIGDMTLRGLMRMMTALAAWHPNRRIWTERFRKNVLAFILRSRQTRQWLRSLDCKPDVILQIGALSNPMISPKVPYTLYLDFTFALTNREWPSRVPMASWEQAMWRRLETKAYRDAAVIFTRSEYTAHSLRSDYGIANDKIVVVGAGVNVALPDLDTLPQREAPHALFIGTDFERKGGDVLLMAWPEVLKVHPDAQLTIVGRTAPSMLPGVTVISGDMNRSLVEQALEEVSVFVMPSRCETWGDVFLEAMAYGLPCIGSTADAMPEIIKEGVSGFLVPPDDPDALAQRIISLFNDPVRAREMGIAGRWRVDHQFLWEHVVERMAPGLAKAAGVRIEVLNDTAETCIPSKERLHGH